MSADAGMPGADLVRDLIAAIMGGVSISAAGLSAVIRKNQNQKSKQTGKKKKKKKKNTMTRKKRLYYTENYYTKLI
mgnify:CR=1 FL=1